MSFAVGSPGLGHLALGFLNPLLLWGLPLAAIPIVIHLLNRRRFDRRRWAAMEFLLRALKRNRRRLRMEQWLVLLLRTLAVLLLVLLVSRPQATGALLGGSLAHHVLVVDDSASMAHRGGADAAFDRATATVVRLAEELAAQRPGDLCTVLLASRPDAPALAAVPVGPGFPSRVRDAVATWRVGDGALDPARVLAAAAQRAAETEEAGETEYHVVTDLRRSDWLDASGQLRPGLAPFFSALADGRTHATLLDVGAADDANLAVTRVAVRDRLLIAGVPVHFAIDVANRGAGPQAATDLTIEVDGLGRVTRPVPALRGGEQTTIELEQTFRSDGPHGLSAALGADRYATDDLRSLAIDVAPAARVLVVDGDPGATDTDAETLFLQAALDPGAEFHSGVDQRLLDDRQLGALTDDDLSGVDLVFLCNVARFDADTVARLQRFAAAGGGIVFCLGDRVDASHYQSALFQDGAGLLPAALGPVRGDLDDPSPAYVAAEDHPVVVRNLDALRFLLTRLTQVGRWFELAGEPDPAARIVLRIDGADGPPLLVERPYHAAAGAGGRTFLLTSSADALWTNLPRLPAFPLLVQEILAYAARANDPSARNLGPDGVWRTVVDPGVHRPDVAVAPLADRNDVTTFAAADALGAEPVAVAVPMAQLRGYGLFEVRRERHAGGSDRELLARNPLLDEGLLTPLPAGELRAVLPEDAQEHVTILRTTDGQSGGVRSLGGDGGLWRWLGALMLVAMLAETILAQRFGRR
ncbi:MAG: BatA domain-containing protein [Planctomycetes bacterium]|nr:BatA domain-containing protein [Planctomycetota bacterium]